MKITYYLLDAVAFYQSTDITNFLRGPIMRDIKVNIVIPVYNEEKTIGNVLEQIEELRPRLPALQVIVVDDGSQDGTGEEVAEFPFVKYVRHEKQRGKGAALRTAIEHCTGDIIVIQDADLEYSPFEIPRLIEPILNGRADVVYGSRLKGRHDDMSFSHYIGNVILSLVARLLYRSPVTDVMTGHKCLTRDAIRTIELTEDGFKIEAEITAKILKNNCRFTEVPITYSKRRNGVSKIRYRDGVASMLKLFALAISRTPGND